MLIEKSLADHGRMHEENGRPASARTCPFACPVIPPVDVKKAFEAGLLACGSPFMPAFPDPWAQWHCRHELTAHSCGDSPGIGRAFWRWAAPDSRLSRHSLRVAEP